MHVTVLTPPSAFIALPETKAHVRVDFDDDDALVRSLIGAVCGWLDGPGGWLGRSIGVQALELRDRGFGSDPLPFGPVVSIDEVKYLDGAGVEQVIDDDSFQLRSNGSLAPLYGACWPSTGIDTEAVRIKYSSGYPDVGDEDNLISTVPGAIRTAALMIVGFLYENREASIDEALRTGPALMLLSPYRVWSI